MIPVTKWIRHGLLSLLLVVVLSSTAFAYDSTTTGTNVNIPTAEQITSMYYQMGLNQDFSVTYASEPSFIAPYSSGSLSQTTLQRGLDALNFVRYVAGLSYNVTLNASYTQLAQDGAFINAMNRLMSHYPTQPDGVSDTLYASGAAACASSNLASTKSSGAWFSAIARDPLYDMIFMWMADEDTTNISTLGHRRWIINPTMTQTGFGWAERNDIPYQSFRAMYAHDGANGATTTTGVLWPAQTMPIQCFENDYPWSYSAGTSVDMSLTTVTLTRVSDGAVWKFSSGGSNGYYNVDNGYYGQTGCIIFRPDSISYKAGDVFNVTITGSVTANYFVTFFDLTTTTATAMSDAQLVPATAASRNTASEAVAATQTDYLAGASSWATDSIETAYTKGLLNSLSSLANNYQTDITREEFCGIMVQYYSAMGGSTSGVSTTNPFSDTTNANVITAYHLGIVNGTSATTFAPQNSITREQMAMMMCNANRALGLPTTGSATLSGFTDSSSISSWALESLTFMNEMGIITGTSSTTIAPQANATREQAIVIAVRALSAFS